MPDAGGELAEAGEVDEAGRALAGVDEVDVNEARSRCRRARNLSERRGQPLREQVAQVFPPLAAAAGGSLRRHPAQCALAGISARHAACCTSRVPSQLHEALVDLFRSRPAFVAELLRSVLHVALPARASVEIVAASFGEARPPEYAADLVLHVRAGRRRFVLIVEVQLDTNADARDAKRRVWPRYVVWQWAEQQCAVYLVVVTPSRRVERWAAQPIAVGHPGFELTPLVLGPSTVPELLDRDRAVESPYLTVLSAVVHGRGPHAVALGELAAEASLAFEPDRRTLYIDMVLAALEPGARRKVEAIMVQKYEYQSEYARRYFGQGLAEGKAEGILRVLEARGFAVPDDVAERVRACRDIPTLDAWLTRAATLTDVRELFG